MLLLAKILSDLEKFRISKNFVCYSNYSEKFNNIIKEASIWMEKYNKYIQDGAQSGYSEIELMNERQQINCLLPFLGLKEESIKLI